MSITISVIAQCESMTQKGAKCRKDATVYEPAMGVMATIPQIISNIVTVQAIAKDFHDFNAIPRGFRCTTHSREGLAEANRRWMENQRIQNYRG